MRETSCQRNDRQNSSQIICFRDVEEQETGIWIRATLTQHICWVYNRYTSRDSVTALQKDLNWPSLTILRKRDRLCTMYKILNNLAAINPQSYLSFSTSVTRRKNDLKLNVFSPSVNRFKYSFFPRTVIDWNNLPNSVVNSKSISSFKTAVMKHLYSSNV